MTIENMLTIVRILVAPVFAACFIAGEHQQQMVFIWMALALAVVIELSDFFDGRIARGRNRVSSFGKIVDPMADSLSRQTYFLSFLICGIIPWWIFIVFMYRDLIISSLRILLAFSGKVQAARISGKLKAGFQAVATFVVLGVTLLRGYEVGPLAQSLWGRHPGFWIMVITAALTLVSMIEYIVPAWASIRATMHDYEGCS
jgi:CDP-diacylglycerol--glycerol-3-phosphate 3-phosphatidyltransferase